MKPVWAVVDAHLDPPGDPDNESTRNGLYWSRAEARDWCQFYNDHWSEQPSVRKPFKRGKHVVVRMVPMRKMEEDAIVERDKLREERDSARELYLEQVVMKARAVVECVGATVYPLRSPPKVEVPERAWIALRDAIKVLDRTGQR